MKIGGSTPARPARAVARSGQATDAGAARGVSAGAGVRAPDSASIMGVPESELTPKVQAALSHLMAEVQDLQRQLDRAHQRVEQLERLSDEDPLLPILNRRAFVRELRRAVSFAGRYGLTSSVLYFDLNGLKTINDAHGHRAGDAALKQVAAVLMQNLRNSDVLGRLGGDEFGVILSQADEATANVKAESLSQVIAATPVRVGELELAVSVTYGVHSFTGEEGEAIEQAIDAADRAMYAKKHRTP